MQRDLVRDLFDDRICSSIAYRNDQVTFNRQA